MGRRPSVSRKKGISKLSILIKVISDTVWFRMPGNNASRVVSRPATQESGEK
jgi:hypothetical protein